MYVRLGKFRICPLRDSDRNSRPIVDMKITMKPIPIDRAGRLVLPKEVRNKMNLREGDLLEAEATADQIVIRLVRSAPAGLIRVGIRMVWNVPDAELTPQDVSDAVQRGRSDRDNRNSEL